jgi:hypothetical protein
MITHKPRIKPNTAAAIGALGLYFDYRQNEVFPNVYVWQWEADLLVVTKAGFAWEIEVKISMGDWRHDISKTKWGHPNFQKLGRFYYAVDAKLLKSGIPDFVPEWAGILQFHLDESSNRMRVKEIRKATPLGGKKLPASIRTKLYRSTYFRYWGKYAPDSVGSVDCRDPELLQSIAHPVPELVGSPRQGTLQFS